MLVIRAVSLDVSLFLFKKQVFFAFFFSLSASQIRFRRAQHSRGNARKYGDALVVVPFWDLLGWGRFIHACFYVLKFLLKYTGKEGTSSCSCSVSLSAHKKSKALAS